MFNNNAGVALSASLFAYNEACIVSDRSCAQFSQNRTIVLFRHFSAASSTSKYSSITSRALFRLRTTLSNIPADTDADKDGTIDTLDASAKSLAMHVVAARPAFLDEASAPPAELEKEKSLLMEQAKDSGKDPKVLGRMVEGRWVLLLLWGWLVAAPRLFKAEESPKRVQRLHNVLFPVTMIVCSSWYSSCTSRQDVENGCLRSGTRLCVRS